MIRGARKIGFWAGLACVSALGAPGFAFPERARADEAAPYTELTVLDDAPGAGASAPWDSIINQDGGANVFFGVNILGPSPFVRNAGSSFMPASNTKLFTSGAALARLGPDYRYETRLEWRRFDPARPGAVTGLTLTGAGDPSWGMSELGEGLRTRVDLIAAALAARGVTEVAGEIRLAADDPRWDRLRYPPGWTPDEYPECYAALAQAFMLQLNCANFTVTGPVTGAWVEAGVPIPVKLNLTPGAHTHVEAVSVSGDGVSLGFELRGTWAAHAAPQTFNFPIHDARAWVGNLLRQALVDQGIRLIAEEPAGAPAEPESLVFYSPPLSAILKPFMKESINQIGDALFKTLGRRFGAPEAADLLEAGEGVLKEYVAGIGNLTARKLLYRPLDGFFSDAVVLRDGSGISHENFVTTPAVMALLRDLNGQATFPTLWDSLPIAGVDGTLKDRMKGTPAQGVLRAKTGTLTGVYNLSGYVPHFGAEGGITDYVPFVMLSTTTSDHRVEARAAQDRVGAALAKLVNPR